jgi:hypothetical protein
MQSAIGNVDPQRLGGGEVFRPFTANGTLFPSGAKLSREQLMAMQPANLRALVSQRFLQVWPVHEATPSEDDARRGPRKRFALPLGGGKFGVVEGWQITDQPVTRAEADHLVAAL